MKAKSAVHGARAAAGQGEAAKTAANRPSAFVSHMPEYRHVAHWPGRCKQNRRKAKRQLKKGYYE